MGRQAQADNADDAVGRVDVAQRWDMYARLGANRGGAGALPQPRVLR